MYFFFFFFFQAEDGIRDYKVTGVQTCALPIYAGADDRHLGDRRVAYALGAELVQHPLRDAHRAAHLRDVLAHDEDVLVVAHGLRERVANGLAIGKLRHRRAGARPLVSARFLLSRSRPRPRRAPAPPGRASQTPHPRARASRAGARSGRRSPVAGGARPCRGRPAGRRCSGPRGAVSRRAGTPGLCRREHASARLLRSRIGECWLSGVDSAQWLSSQTNKAGTPQSWARLSDSWKVPMFVAPSPKNATPTLGSPRNLKASAAPTIAGRPPPTTAFAPRLPRSTS